MADKNAFNLKLEMYLLNELPTAEKKQLEAELERNADLKAQLEKLRGDTAAYYARYPHLNLPQRRVWWKERSFRLFAGGLAFATAAVLVVILVPHPAEKMTPEAQDRNAKNAETLLALNHNDGAGDRSKGMQPGLFLSAQREGKPADLRDGSLVSPGEDVTIGYRASGYKYGVIISVDSAKTVTLHFPETASGSQQLAQGNARLKMAFRPDETPGFEKFFFVASVRPLAVQQIENELKKTGSLKPAPDTDMRITSVSLAKK